MNKNALIVVGIAVAASIGWIVFFGGEDAVHDVADDVLTEDVVEFEGDKKVVEDVVVVEPKSKPLTEPKPTPKPKPKEPIVEETISITPDVLSTVPPVISNIAVGSIFETSAIISWSTDESSSSKVIYDTVSPALDGGNSKISAVFLTGHSVPLFGLKKGTKYYFVIQSTDVKGNTATSKEGTFSTIEVIPEPEPVVPESEPEPEPEPAPSSSLVGHWKFDDGSGTDISDSSEIGNLGTLFNADFQFTWATGLIGGALKFDNNDDYVNIPHSTSLNLGGVGESYTVSFWFKRDGEPDVERLIIGKGPDDIVTPFIIRIDSLGYPIFRISDGAHAPTIRVRLNIGGVTGWHHVAAVRDASADVIRLYVDGAEGEEASVDTTVGSIKNTKDVRINYTKVGPTSFFSDPFYMDDLRINNVALSTAEIKALFDAGK